jgi:hypothetical protein
MGSTTADLIKSDLSADIQAANPTVDVVKGPVYDLLLAPIPHALAEISDAVTELSNLYSPVVSGDGTNDEIVNTLGQAFRVPKPVGTRSRVTLVFWFTTLPSSPITIPAGTAVATSDRSVIYTTESAIAGITVATAYRFYNATTSRYEINIDAVASVTGSGTSVPSNRLVSLLSRVPGISGVYNPSASSVGRDAGSTDAYLTQIQRRFLGADSSSFARSLEQIAESYPDAVTDFVLTTDYDSFRRHVRGDALDCILLDPVPATATDVFDASTGAYSVTGTVFRLRAQPVLADSVAFVFVNGTVIPEANYEVEYDDALETRWSTRAVTSVRILSKLKATDTVTVSYSYCSGCRGIQDAVFGTGNGTDFFGVDALVRLSETVDVVVAVTVRASAGIGSDSLSGLNAATVQSIGSAIADFFTAQAFTTTVVPDQLVAELNSRFQNLRQIQITRFHRADSYASQVEPIVLRKYETPRAATNNISVTQA